MGHIREADAAPALHLLGALHHRHALARAPQRAGQGLAALAPVDTSMSTDRLRMIPRRVVRPDVAGPRQPSAPPRQSSANGGLQSRARPFWAQ